MSPFSLGILGSARVAAGGGSFAYLGGGSTGEVSTAAQTVSGLAFGAAADDRVLVAAIGTRVSQGRGLTGVTIGGVAATIDSVTTTWPSAIIARAVVPTGTSGSVVITLTNWEFGPWRVALYGTYGTVTVVDAEQQYTNTSGGTVSLTHSAGDALVAVSALTNQGGQTTTHTWSGGRVSDYGTSSTGQSGMYATHENGLASGPSTVAFTTTGGIYQGMAAVAYTIT